MFVTRSRKKKENNIISQIKCVDVMMHVSYMSYTLLGGRDR